jgi:glutamate N-acetyltransferase/amino-acid N-acetyltransferase
VIAHQLKINTRETAVSSTGIIGKPLPLTKIKKAVPVLVSGLGTSAAKGTAAAAAIMTTDTFVKETAVSLKIGGKTVTIGGCAKGSGMIEPNMATMLAYVTTDAAIDKRMLKQALADAVDRSFHCITVDGCMSTNDMTIVLANGLAGNRRITAKGQAFDVFCQALTAVCFDLAKKIVRDGEGAKKLLQVSISGAPTAATARRAAKAVANSNLVKTAAYGKNANWGRIAAAVGSLGLNITEDRLTIQTRMIGGRDVMIHADLGLGQAEATVLTCDLTEDYIKINGAYN